MSFPGKPPIWRILLVIWLVCVGACFWWLHNLANWPLLLSLPSAMAGGSIFLIFCILVAENS